MKIKIPCVLVILIFLSAFSSCTTLENILTFKDGNGSQIFFVRPVTFSLQKSVASKLSFDMTINVADSKIQSNPLFNYTITIPEKDAKKYENIILAIKTDEKEIIIEKKSILFKELDSNKNLAVRYTSSICIEDFYSILNSKNPVTINIKCEQNFSQIISKDFEKNLSDLRILLL